MGNAICSTLAFRIAKIPKKGASMIKYQKAGVGFEQ